MSFTFFQFDKRWASHLYPLKNKKKSTMKTSGCCPTSMADIIYNLEKNILPPKVADYSSSIGGATQGGASYHSTPMKLANHYGLKGREIGTMSEFLKLMKTGKYWGLLLFKAGSRGGVKWTSGGHYIACTDFKGTDSLYMRDSGARKHIGWYSYNKHMKGLIKKAWVFEPAKPVVAPKPVETKPVETKPAVKKAYKIVEASSSGSQACKHKDWYRNTKVTYSNWTAVIRCKDTAKAQIIAREALKAAKKSNIKYSTTTKGYTLPKKLKSVGWDMSKVNTTVYTSCTPLAMACVLCAGIGRENPKYYQWARSSTNSIASRLSKTGQFTVYKDSKMLAGEGLQPGDIVISKTHGVIVTEVK